MHSGAPLTEEESAELAFQGQEAPSPLGYLQVPIADLPGLDRRYYYCRHVEKSRRDLLAMCRVALTNSSFFC